MARLMSVAYTEQQVRDRTKTVTRRAGWWETRSGKRILHPGDELTLCRKVMGRKHGEPLVRICTVGVLDVNRELLSTLLATDPAGAQYARDELTREGFPDLTPREFIQRYFTEPQNLYPDDMVTRIEWTYIS